MVSLHRKCQALNSSAMINMQERGDMGPGSARLMLPSKMLLTGAKDGQSMAQGRVKAAAAHSCTRPESKRYPFEKNS